MKNLILGVMLLLFLSACDSDSGVSSNTDTGIDDGNGKVVVSVNLSDVSSEEDKSRVIYSDTTNIILRAYNSDRSVYSDTEISAGSNQTVELSLPEGTYTLEALAIKEKSSVCTLLSAGSQSELVISPNTMSSASITMAKPTFSVTYKNESGDEITEFTSGEIVTFSMQSSLTSNAIFNSISYRLYDTSGDNVILKFTDSSQTDSFTVPSVNEVSVYTVKPHYQMHSSYYGSFINYSPTESNITINPESSGVIVTLD